jgi:hypothetical protein
MMAIYPIFVDDTMIPTPFHFWQTIGPPFIGDYRRASVVHDYYCQTKNEPWKAVHRMFYEASVVGGVSEIKAKIMFAAVYAGGPRCPVKGRLGATYRPNPNISNEQMHEITRWIKNNNPGLGDIEKRLDQ